MKLWAENINDLDGQLAREAGNCYCGEDAWLLSVEQLICLLELYNFDGFIFKCIGIILN